MSSVNEIEEAVLRLPAAELAAFRAWFAEFDAAAWDRRIEDDVASGRLDALADEALEDLRAGRCTERGGTAPIPGSGILTPSFPKTYPSSPRNPIDCCGGTRSIRPCTSRRLGGSGPPGSVCITSCPQPSPMPLIYSASATWAAPDPAVEEFPTIRAGQTPTLPRRPFGGPRARLMDGRVVRARNS